MQIGCSARYFNAFGEEVEFAKKNNFQFMQIWYDRDGIAEILGFDLNNEVLKKVDRNKNRVYKNVDDVNTKIDELEL